MPIALAPMIIGVIVLVLAIALWFIAEGVARLIGSSIPFIGGAIGDAIRSSVGAVTGWFLTAQDGAVSSVAWFFTYLANWIWAHLYGLFGAIANTASNAYWGLVNVGAVAASVTPTAVFFANAAVTKSEQFTDAAIGTLAGQVDDLYNQAVAAGNAAAATAVNLARDLYNAAEADITALSGAVSADVVSLGVRVGAVEQEIQGDIGQVLSNIQANLAIATATALADAEAAEARAVAAAATATTIAIGATEAGLNGAVHDLVLGPWEALLPAITGIAGTLDPAIVGPLGLAPAITEPLPATVPGVMSFLGAALGAVAADVADCLTPNCSALKSMGGLFNGLESLGLAGLLMALAAQAIADPADAATEVIAATGWVPGLLTELTDAVVG